MKFHFARERWKNENGGIVMIMTLMLLVTLTLAGIMAINISNNEANIVRNEQIAATEFYNAETGLNIARVQYPDWMTNDFLSESETEANNTLFYGADNKKYDTLALLEGANTNLVATLRVRCIEDNATDASGEKAVTPIFGSEDLVGSTGAVYPIADEMPAMSHQTSPPAGSGYSVKYFEARRFSLTVTSENGTIVQSGVWKVFNKY